MQLFFRHCALSLVGALLVVVGASAPVTAAEPFKHGWTLDTATSELRVMSIKRSTKAESSPFRGIAGQIGEDGKAEITVLLDSIDTGIDLRNVRMRFLFFETFKFPEAKILATIDPAMLSDLHAQRVKRFDLPYRLELRGVGLDRSDPVQVTLIDNDTVVITSARPIPIALTDFDLEEGRRKLEDAAQVDIVPVGTVSFVFQFTRTTPTIEAQDTPVAAEASTGTSLGVAAGKAATDPEPEPQPEPQPEPATAALETEADFNEEGCAGRFEILSRTGNIYFRRGSAVLQSESEPLLETLRDIVERCPAMRVQVAGHTDSDGAAAINQQLSEARAAAVVSFLQDRGVPSERLSAIGFGETQPRFPNDSAENKRRNRRIEFTVIGG